MATDMSSESETAQLLGSAVTHFDRGVSDLIKILPLWSQVDERSILPMLEDTVHLNNPVSVVAAVVSGAIGGLASEAVPSLTEKGGGRGAPGLLQAPSEPKRGLR